MTPTLNLTPDAVLLDQPAVDLRDVIELAAPVVAERGGVETSVARRALLDAASESDFAVGAGVAVPHVAVPDLADRAICLVRTAEPVGLGAVDGEPIDLFFVVLYPAGDPSAHLQFLAHLAGMCRSRLFRHGLRSATTARAVTELVVASEARLRGASYAVGPAATQRGLAIISVSGERAADAILVGLLRAELTDATIVDAQTVQDAASREVPLFAGFRDLFGDPGGRRMIFAPIDLEHIEELAAIVEDACEDERSADAELIVLPVSSRWRFEQAAPAARSASH